MKLDLNADMLRSMKHSPIHNYVVPGVTSWLIGGQSPFGILRMLVCERHQVEAVAPHSHRFDSSCTVLSGTVRQRIWTPTGTHDGDFYAAKTIHLAVVDTPGKYLSKQDAESDVRRWDFVDKVYEAGESYEMPASQVHSIYFSRGTEVLFLQGPDLSNSSIVLEPFVNGKVVKTFIVEPWQFKE